MGFLTGAGGQLIGKARNAGHAFHFSQTRNNRLVCTFVDYYTHQGSVFESRDQGMEWTQVGETGQSQQIATRNGQVTFTKGESHVGSYDSQQGNVTEDTKTRVPTGNGVVVPNQETGLYMVPTTGSGIAMYNHETGRLSGGSPERVRGFWGSGEPGANVGGMWLVYHWYDPTYPLINYHVLARWNGKGWTNYHPHPGSRYPIPLAYEYIVGGTGYEGWENAGSSLSGVGYRAGTQGGFFKLADHWTQYGSSTPVYIPNLGSLDSKAYRAILSIPNGLEDDVNYTRGAMMGYVGGYPTFGLIEPGYGFSWSRGFIDPTNYSGIALNSDLERQPPGRKFLGSFDLSFSRARLHMPYTLGIFGMGVIGHVRGDPHDCLSLFWVYDSLPFEYPRAVRVEDGKYTNRIQDSPHSAHAGAGTYTRW